MLVLSPQFAGTYSKNYDRVLLEAGQDVAKTASNPVQGAQNFVDQLNTRFSRGPVFDCRCLAVGAASGDPTYATLG